MYYLEHVVLCFEFGKPLSPLAQVVESLVGAKLEEDVYILVVFEDMFETHNVLMT